RTLIACAFSALVHSNECCTTEQVQIGICKRAVEQANLSTERNNRDLRCHDPVQTRDLLGEVVADVGRHQLAVERTGRGWTSPLVVDRLDLTCQPGVDVRAEHRSGESTPNAD